MRLWLAVFIMMALCVPAAAAAEPSRVLKVPFVELEGLMEKNPDGTRRGLVVDYLNEIAKYTGWEYEYVDTTGDTMLDEFFAGEYDLMGASYYLPELEDRFAYPDYSMGSSRAVLLARKDDDRIHATDVRSLNGKTIGVYDRAVENVRRMKEYLKMNGLECNLKYYSIEQLSPEGTLYPYLESGEVDLLLGNSAELRGPFRVAFSYESQPYYIVTTIGNQEILDGLNMAMERILDSNPNFATERYNANFWDSSMVDIHISGEERDYICERGAVSVAIPRNFHPLCCEDTGGVHDGLVNDVLREITAFTGLEFSCIYVDTYSEARQMVQQGQADMMGFFLDSEEESIRQDLVLTAPFVSMNSIVVRNKAVSFPKTGLVGAMIEGQKMPGGIQAAEVRFYPDSQEALAAVNRGEADFVFGMAAHLESIIQRRYYANVVPATIVNDRSTISFAMPRPADPQLLTILNKAINNISSTRKEELLDQNMVSVGTGQMTLEELIYANPVVFMAILSLVLFILAGAVLWITHTRMKAAVIESNLEKARAESRAKGEFLSRMSHELRTPMNAVVGLADLTSMTEGVPENVRGNLSKLRASSYYLLELINDILDTSRLDSGMLTIASEPFSLENMLEKIQDMMEPDAKQRGLTYLLEKKIEHSGVTGDITRLRQVLTNLLSNAFKFTPAGGKVVLQVTETACDEHGATYTFRVADNGVGIAPEDQERIFETFEQVGANYSKSQGTGLGLPISQKLVEKMGGCLRVSSRPGRGSEFFFDIVLPYGNPPEEDQGRQERADPGETLEGIRIMLVEDNDLNAEIATELLTRCGAVVSRCENGKVALERFAGSGTGEFQVILMDIQMPLMNGLEATRAIRGLERADAKTIPIVAMTANAFQEDVDEAMDAGMNGFVSKPMDVERLYRLLAGLLKR